MQMTIAKSTSSGDGPAPPLDHIFHPRSVAVAGVSPQQSASPGFAGVGLGFLLAHKEAGFEPLYAVNPKYNEVEGVPCYASVLDIPGPVDHVISSVPARSVPQLLEDCIGKGVRTIHFFTAGFSETGDEEMAAMEAKIVARAKEAGVRVLGPNCMGLYVPESRLSFGVEFPHEPGPVGMISQSGGNAFEMITASSVRGIRFSKVISYGNASDIDESELLDYLAADPATEIICAYIEGVRDGRRFFSAVRRAAAAKPTIVLKGGRTPAGTRAVMSHTASLAGSFQVFDALCRQVNAVRVDSIEEMVDLAVAFRFMAELSGPGVAIVGGGGGFSVFAADEINEAGLECPILPERTQQALAEFNPAAGTSVRNPVDTLAIFQPPGLERTLRIVGEAENVDVVIFHTSFSWGSQRRSAAASGMAPDQQIQSVVDQIVGARRATCIPVVAVVRPPTDLDGMERVLLFQQKCNSAQIPVYPTIPRAANAIAAHLRWSRERAARSAG